MKRFSYDDYAETLAKYKRTLIKYLGEQNSGEILSSEQIDDIDRFNRMQEHFEKLAMEQPDAFEGREPYFVAKPLLSISNSSKGAPNNVCENH